MALQVELQPTMLQQVTHSLREKVHYSQDPLDSLLNSALLAMQRWMLHRSEGSHFVKECAA